MTDPHFAFSHTDNRGKITYSELLAVPLFRVDDLIFGGSRTWDPLREPLWDCCQSHPNLFLGNEDYDKQQVDRVERGLLKGDVDYADAMDDLMISVTPTP